jgi:WD40 repeat protein
LFANETSSRPGHLDTVTSVTTASDPDGGSYVVSGGRDGAVLRWDARTGEARGLVHATENPILTVAAGHGTDGHMVISGDLAGIFRRSALEDGLKGGIKTVTEPFTPAIVAVACSSELGRPFQAVVCDSWGSRTQFRPGPEEDFDLRPAFGTQVNAVAWLRLADGVPVIVTSTADRSAAVWDVETANLLYRMTNLSGEVTSVAGLSGAGGIVVAGCRNGEVHCWRLEDGEPLPTLTGHIDAVTAVACTSDAEEWIVAAVAANGVIRLWRMADPAWPEVVTLPEVSRSLHFTPDGGLVAGYGWEVARFDPAEGSPA